MMCCAKAALSPPWMDHPACTSAACPTGPTCTASSPATSTGVDRGATLHKATPCSPAAANLCRVVAERAHSVGRAEGSTPIVEAASSFERCFVVPATDGRLRVGILLSTWLLCMGPDIVETCVLVREHIGNLALLRLVVVPATCVPVTGMPTTSMPATCVPTTSLGMHCGTTTHESPRASATAHLCEATAKCANRVGCAE